MHGQYVQETCHCKLHPIMPTIHSRNNLTGALGFGSHPCLAVQLVLLNEVENPVIQLVQSCIPPARQFCTGRQSINWLQM